MIFGTVWAQSVLSLPSWIETRIQPAHTSSLLMRGFHFQLAVTETLEKLNPEERFISNEEPNSTEIHILPADASSPSITVFQLAITQIAKQPNPEEIFSWNERQNSEDSSILQKDPSGKNDPFPKEINFHSITTLLKNDPQQAFEDLKRIRESLTHEEVLILEIQIIHYLGQYEQTEVLSNGFLEAFPESTFLPQAYYYYHKSLSLQHKFPDRQQDLDEKIFAQLSGELQADLLQIFGRDALAREDIQGAIRYFLRQLEISSQQSPVISQEILTILSTIDSVELLQSIENEYSHFDFIKAELPYLRLKLLLEQLHYEPALELTEILLSESTIQNDLDRLEYLSDVQKRLQVTLQANPRRIGVILPSSSDIPQAVRLTQEVLEGLRLGLLAFEEEEQTSLQNPNSQEIDKSEPFELVLRDSELDEEASARAVRELVEEEHVIAIIGPLIRRTSVAAAQEAQRLHVPLISLSLTSSIPDIGSYIFRNNQSWEQEMKALVRYAFDYKNARRFLILYPRTNKGKSEMAYFWKEVERLGGTIRGGEIFDLGQKTFVKQFEKFTGMDRYIPPDEQKMMEELEEKLQPLHDFDALFIPIGRNSIDDLNVLLPYLAFYKMNDIVFLGDSGWNDYSVVSAINKYVKDSIFVDSFFKQNTQTHVQRFVRLHERYFLRHLNYKGPSSYSAYSYDTVNLLIKLLSSPKNQSHLALQQALINMRPYSGVTGIITFLVNGEAHREMKLLTIQSGKIVSVN